MIQPILLIGIGILIAYLFSVTLLASYKGDRSIANFTWGGGCAVLGLYTFFAWKTLYPRQIIVTVLVVVWASRLIAHLYMRYNRTDPRFVVWRERGTEAFFTTLSYVFGVQLILLLVMCYPVCLINSMSDPSLNRLDIFGIIVWALGFIFESISDFQLYRFTAQPANANKIMDQGLWRYSRHPNYFGEIISWIGISIIAQSVPGGRLALLAPITISLLLLFVTGIPWIEKAMDSNPDYRAYKERTSVFFPWFPKR